MTFEPTDEVLQIKRQLQEKEGIQVDQIRLIYSGKQLADDKPLEFYNIQAGGTIHMVLQLRGGGAREVVGASFCSRRAVFILVPSWCEPSRPALARSPRRRSCGARTPCLF